MVLQLVDDARREGLDVSFDLYPYGWASTRLLIMLPTWLQAGGVDRLRERLADLHAFEGPVDVEVGAKGRVAAWTLDDRRGAAAS